MRFSVTKLAIVASLYAHNTSAQHYNEKNLRAGLVKPDEQERELQFNIPNPVDWVSDNCGVFCNVLGLPTPSPTPSPTQMPTSSMAPSSMPVSGGSGGGGGGGDGGDSSECGFFCSLFGGGEGNDEDDGDEDESGSGSGGGGINLPEINLPSFEGGSINFPDLNFPSFEGGSGGIGNPLAGLFEGFVSFFEGFGINLPNIFGNNGDDGDDDEGNSTSSDSGDGDGGGGFSFDLPEWPFGGGSGSDSNDSEDTGNSTSADSDSGDGGLNLGFPEMPELPDNVTLNVPGVSIVVSPEPIDWPDLNPFNKEGDGV